MTAMLLAMHKVHSDAAIDGMLQCNRQKDAGGPTCLEDLHAFFTWNPTVAHAPASKLRNDLGM